MVLHQNGIICGGAEYAPKLEKLSSVDRLTFYVLMTRGGNQKKNYDVFQVKVFGNMAKKYYEELKDDKSKGKTIGLQLSLENNSNSFVLELICTYANFVVGEEIYLPNLPEYAKKTITKTKDVQEQTNVSCTEEKLNNDKVAPIVNFVPEPIKEHEIVDVAAETMGEIADVFLQAPIGIIAKTKMLFANSKLVSVKSRTTGNLADNKDYLVFRSMMGYN